jgi:hypothetical protein
MNVVLHSTDPNEEPKQPDPIELTREKDPSWQIEVPEDLKISHPVVKRAGIALRQAAREGARTRVHWNDRYRAQLVQPGAGHLDIAVSKALIPRALRIMQALITACDRRGYRITISPKNQTLVTVLDESFAIALVERFKQVPTQSFGYAGVGLEPSGRLTLRIGDSYSNSGVTDKPPQLIEQRLNHFLRTLVRRALELKHERTMREDRERRWRIHDDDRRGRQQVRDSERLRVRRLRTLAAEWSRRERTMKFVAAVEQRMAEGGPEAPDRETAERWIQWAKSHLQKSDPVGTLMKEPWPTAPMPPAASAPWDWR